MTRRLPLSVIIIARNEADRLPRSLASLHWVDQIVLVDSGSDDGTAELARAAGAEVVTCEWQGYSAQKQLALTHVRHPWVLWVDADEIVSAELQRAITRVLTAAGLATDAAPAAARGATRPAAYAMNRRTWYLGRFVRFGGWYPDRKVRLFRRDRARFDERLVHEGLSIDGAIGRLEGDLLHYSYRDLSHHVLKTQQLATLWAADPQHRRRVTAFELVLRPAAKWFKSYILRGGFLEGWRGLLIAGMGAYSVWLKYALLRERQAQTLPAEERSHAVPSAGPRTEGGKHAGSGQAR